MAGRVVIGTRGSALAMWQADWVKSALEGLHPGLAVELAVIKTQGDKILDVPLAKVGGKGLFVKEIEEALLDGRIDLAVHSMKDMPSELPAGLSIGAIPAREQPTDALVARTAEGLSALPRGARIGTSSLRRAAQLRHRRPDVVIEALRGNLDTRLRKLETQALDAIVLATAGIRRLGLEDRITEVLDPEVMVPAVGQGALCIETRGEDGRIHGLVGSLEDPATRWAVTAERAFLHRLEGGCQVPIAGHATVRGRTLELTGLVSDLEGRRVVRHRRTGTAEDAAALGLEVAEALLADGAGEILKELQEEATSP